MRRSAVVLSATVVSLGVLLAPGVAQARFKGNLCRLPTAGELGAAHITASCNKVRTTRSSAASPLGTLKSELFQAYWGSNAKSGPTHGLVVHLTHFGGASAVVTYARKHLGKLVLEHGAPVGVGSVSSWHGETSTCANPPTGDCTFVALEAIVKNYELVVLLSDFPLTGVEENMPGDEAADLEQEEADRGPAIAIAKSIAKVL